MSAESLVSPNSVATTYAVPFVPEVTIARGGVHRRDGGRPADPCVRARDHVVARIMRRRGERGCTSPMETIVAACGATVVGVIAPEPLAVNTRGDPVSGWPVVRSSAAAPTVCVPLGPTVQVVVATPAPFVTGAVLATLAAAARDREMHRDAGQTDSLLASVTVTLSGRGSVEFAGPVWLLPPLMAMFAAGPAAILNAAEVALAYPAALATTVYPAPTLLSEKALNVATPAPALTLAVPLSVEAPGFAPRARVTVPVKPGT